MSMRRLIRQLEESDRGTKAALTRLNREADKRNETEMFAAKALLDSLELVVKRAKTDGYYKLKFSDRAVQKKYDEGWKYLRDAISELNKVNDVEDLQNMVNVDTAMLAMSQADRAFFKVIVLALRDPSAAPSMPLMKGLLDEIRSAKETWRLSSGI